MRDHGATARTSYGRAPDPEHDESAQGLADERPRVDALRAQLDDALEALHAAEVRLKEKDGTIAAMNDYAAVLEHDLSELAKMMLSQLTQMEALGYQWVPTEGGDGEVMARPHGAGDN